MYAKLYGWCTLCHQFTSARVLQVPMVYCKGQLHDRCHWSKKDCTVMNWMMIGCDEFPYCDTIC